MGSIEVDRQNRPHDPIGAGAGATADLSTAPACTSLNLSLDADRYRPVHRLIIVLHTFYLLRLPITRILFSRRHGSHRDILFLSNSYNSRIMGSVLLIIFEVSE